MTQQQYIPTSGSSSPNRKTKIAPIALDSTQTANMMVTKDTIGCLDFSRRHSLVLFVAHTKPTNDITEIIMPSSICVGRRNLKVKQKVQYDLVAAYSHGTKFPILLSNGNDMPRKKKQT